MNVISRRQAVLGASALAMVPNLATATAIDRPARVIVGFPPGGSSDITARLYAQHLAGVYAPEVKVENHPGSGGRVGIDTAKNAAPDGTTYIQSPSSMLTLQPHVVPKEVKYDALRDLTPVTAIGSFAYALAVRADHPAKDFAGFVTWAKAQPDISFASPIPGAAPHFTGLIVAKSIGVTFAHLEYRGAAPAVADVLSGLVQVFVGVLPDVTRYIDRELRVLAITSPQRHPRYSGIPTFKELGISSFVMEEWFGVFLPGGATPATSRALFDSIGRVAAIPSLRDELARTDYDVSLSASPAEFAERVGREREEWGRIVRASGVHLDE